MDTSASTHSWGTNIESTRHVSLRKIEARSRTHRCMFEHERAHTKCTCSSWCVHVRAQTDTDVCVSAPRIYANTHTSKIQTVSHLWAHGPPFPVPQNLSENGRILHAGPIHSLLPELMGDAPENLECDGPNPGHESGQKRGCQRKPAVTPGWILDQ